VPSSSLAITVLGHDRPGIIAEVTGALAELGGNLEDSSMTLLRGHFAWTLIVSGPSVDDVRDRLASLADDDLVVTVLPAPGESGILAAASRYVLSVHGGDRPGIVSGITGVVAAVGGNIVDLTTRLSGDLYIAVAEVVLPEGVDIPHLERDLSAAADALGVGVTLRPEDADLL
jgi:glycine cleavage system transcriptional repressor